MMRGARREQDQYKSCTAALTAVNYQRERSLKLWGRSDSGPKPIGTCKQFSHTLTIFRRLKECKRVARSRGETAVPHKVALEMGKRLQMIPIYHVRWVDEEQLQALVTKNRKSPDEVETGARVDLKALKVSVHPARF